MASSNVRRQFARERALRRDVSRFDILVKTPANLVSSLVLPGNGEFYVKLGIANASAVIVFTANGRNIYVPIQAAPDFYHIGRLEKDTTLVTVYNASTAALYVRAPSGALLLIGSK